MMPRPSSPASSSLPESESVRDQAQRGAGLIPGYGAKDGAIDGAEGRRVVMERAGMKMCVFFTLYCDTVQAPGNEDKHI